MNKFKVPDYWFWKNFFNRKEILQDLMFIECGYVWHFNGFDKSWRTPLMRDTWNNIKNNYGELL